MDATISEFEAELIDRARGLIVASAVAADPDGDASPRAYLGSPIAYAIRKSGGTVASLRTPADADTLTVADDLLDQCFDIAELRLLDNCLGNWTEPDQSEGPLSQRLVGLANFYLERAERLRKKIQDVYKIDADVPVVGDDGAGDFSGSPPTSSAGSIAYL